MSAGRHVQGREGLSLPHRGSREGRGFCEGEMGRAKTWPGVGGIWRNLDAFGKDAPFPKVGPCELVNISFGASIRTLRARSPGRE